MKEGQKGTRTSFAASILIHSRTNTHSNLLKEWPCFNRKLAYLQSSQDLTHNLIIHQPPNQKGLLQSTCAEGSCSKRCIIAIQEGCHIFCHILVDHKTTPGNLRHWGHSKSHFKTASFSTKSQRNLHKFHGGTCFSILIVHFFKHSPGRLAQGPSCAMDFHCRFGKVTQSNRLRALHSIITFQLIPMGIRLHPQSHWFLTIPWRIRRINFLSTSLYTAYWKHFVFNFLLFSYLTHVTCSAFVPVPNIPNSWLLEWLPPWCILTGKWRMEVL